jgi:hypothetical protein
MAIGQFVQVEGPTGIIISIAAWMFNPIACAKMVVGAPCVDLATLLALKQVLIGPGPARDPPSDKGFVRGKGDEASRVADGNSGPADAPVVRQQLSRRTGGSGTKQVAAALAQKLMQAAD